ncbi:MAG: 3-isopropylmalate dehydrogenase [Buchnera aphidicola (Periphyllus lyropictus)]|uniref:3-isopropylmalate dehydrogenase n=1 Tax=Buchnera aphidicola TaxID=9 RepID=UPI001EC40E78|nr:3-isopropylmalate dehydrogenase [Buchnera aphidicola]NIH16720.1 3-isopropylmalate dehydrogenase [Buchnera aphidicola (Periphyllus lyropictus)]USS94625.1 3-isopropylmalate dehydrogenase [Buchnera aphidicola (Periphyllus lyropictus)]
MKKNKKKYKIAILPGDGIGPEVMKETYKIIKIVKEKFLINLKTKEYDIGGVAIDKHGIALPKKTLNGCKNSDAILLGSIGGPKWDKLSSKKRPETSALLSIRKYFKFFINFRPANLYKKLYYLSPLKKNISKKGFNILCIRELIGGIYFGKPSKEIKNKKEHYALDTSIYKKKEIVKIAKIAFKTALKRKRKITSIDKANVLKTSKLWRKTVNEVSKNYPTVKISHLYFDNAIMQIIKNPSQFDVILCPNLIGDVISDECGILTGSIGMLPSASLNSKKFGLYEPAGGSAPDIKGKNIANPIAQILSFSMLLKYSLKLNHISKLINLSVKKTLMKGFKTFDLSDGKKFITTKQMGNEISKSLIEEYKNEKNIISKNI